MKTEIVVRRATLDDLPAIVELRLALLREYGDHPVYRNLRRDAEERAFSFFSMQLASARETIFVADRRGRTVGVLRCVDMPSSPLLDPERYCYVSSVYVRPADRRKGVLRALLHAAEAWCEERGLDEMRLHNSSSTDAVRRTWSALGFEVVEEVRRRPLAKAAAPRAAARAHAGAR